MGELFPELLRGMRPGFLMETLCSSSHIPYWEWKLAFIHWHPKQHNCVGPSDGSPMLSLSIEADVTAAYFPKHCYQPARSTSSYLMRVITSSKLSNHCLVYDVSVQKRPYCNIFINRDAAQMIEGLSIYSYSSLTCFETNWKTLSGKTKAMISTATWEWMSPVDWGLWSQSA